MIFHVLLFSVGQEVNGFILDQGSAQAFFQFGNLCLWRAATSKLGRCEVLFFLGKWMLSPKSCACFHMNGRFWIQPWDVANQQKYNIKYEWFQTKSLHVLERSWSFLHTYRIHFQHFLDPFAKMSHLHRHQDLRIVPDAILLFLPNCSSMGNVDDFVGFEIAGHPRKRKPTFLAFVWSNESPLQQSCAQKKSRPCLSIFFWSWVLKLHPKETKILRVFTTGHGFAWPSCREILLCLVIEVKYGCFPASFHSWKPQKKWWGALPETNIAGPWKLMFGRCISYWKCQFSGANC